MYNLIHFIVTALLVILIILDILFLQGRLKFNAQLGAVFGASLLCFDEAKTPLFLIASMISGIYVAFDLLSNYICLDWRKYNKFIRSFVYILSMVLLTVEIIILYSTADTNEQLVYITTLFITFLPIGASVSNILDEFNQR